MKPIYKAFQDFWEFYQNYGYLPESSLEEREASDVFARNHNHVCWLNPTQSIYNRKTQRLCKKYCKANHIPKEPNFGIDYNCDVCPNLITYHYDESGRVLLAMGNMYLYDKVEHRLDSIEWEKDVE